MTTRRALGNLDDALEVVEQECTAEQIHEFMKSYKEDAEKEAKRDIRLTAENKARLVNENLRRAVTSGQVPLDRVWTLIRETEENGYQHVLFFEPKDRPARHRISDYDHARKRLLAEHSLRADDLPRNVRPSKSYALVDFRVDHVEGPEGSFRWTAKFYGTERYKQRAGKEMEGDDGVFWIPYKWVERRTVLVAIYRSWGLLELRVPRLDSATVIGSMFSQLEELLSPAFAPGLLRPWDLTPARKRILDEERQNKTVYVAGALLLGDKKMGTAAITPQTEEENLFADAARAKAVEAYMSTGSPCRNLRVTWLEQKDRVPAVQQLVTVLGSPRQSAPPNELIAISKVSAATMDYVVHRLRQFQS